MSAALLHMYAIVPRPRLMFLHPNFESAKMLLVWTNMSFRTVQLLIYSKELQ